MTVRRNVLAISLGCPAGIGPEVAVKAAAAAPASVTPLLVGDPAVIARAVARAGLDLGLSTVESAAELGRVPRGAVAVYAKSARLAGPAKLGRPDASAGAAQLAWVDQATDLVTAGLAGALVTGPVSKHAIATSGARGAAKFLGHTEHLARRLGAREVVMAFWSRALVTALVTTHVPIGRVPRALTAGGVATATYWLARLLSSTGVRSPRIAVASLNPHAGEDGLLGGEEAAKIAPGIEAAKARLASERRRARITGPLGAETAIRKAAAGPRRSFDGVVAMAHDQATIPMKLLAFGDAVNVTLGLPIVRTSVDHGTGYDIAPRGVADPSGMIAAMQLAARLTRA
ncbi:MAG: 4-hydroxythreonine-4-phosphate dehydrogenase PdxA [Polyangiaceae bacterium]|jgi:4-hydroxythreonine-4-phosphate dehydrogenase|nr:4-hydroxythreonine-4-phosphate dehydrogenase PdxA [Polyangiaceae bacterium]MBK8943376.1 4-hydroxythreonine-4-phosphate dehydrogenase PdxA [Polyangiaceae bacterium]